jgi:hypothetical protein
MKHINNILYFPYILTGLNNTTNKGDVVSTKMTSLLISFIV